MTPFDSPDFDGHQAVHFITDERTGLEAIIAIHSTFLGPAAGGCRYWIYPSHDAALTDVLRLSRGMSYKNAMAGLPFGGGKAVVLKRPGGRSKDLFGALGRAVESLGGSYVTAEDVGTSVEDMQAVAHETRYVSGLRSSGNVAGGNPSPKTALGVFLSIQAGWRHLAGTSLEGVRVAVQGLGGVGCHLSKHLHQAGARLFVSDVVEERVRHAEREFGAVRVQPETILAADVDVLAPCALGAILNKISIRQISARLVAGGANNQLATPQDGYRLREAGVLYAPDYVVNAGGIICVASEYLGTGSEAQVYSRIEQIPITLTEIFKTAVAESLPTDVVSDRIARQRLQRPAVTPQSHDPLIVPGVNRSEYTYVARTDG